MARPGIMLYFDILKPLRVLPDADKGRLFEAILEYGENGTIPSFDGMLAMAWGFIQPKLDRDCKEYERTVLKRQYAVFCRELKKKGAPEVSFDDWMMMDDNERNQLLSHDVTRYPTTTVTPTTTVAAAADETGMEEDAAAAAADRKLKMLGGSLGQGVVSLSDYQIDSLLDKMGVDMFDHYVRKLSDFIIKNGASVKSHYSTILKWWTEDSAV